MSGYDHSTIQLDWTAPFSDGVWIDGHEVQVVQLPDVYLPGGTVDGTGNASVASMQQLMDELGLNEDEAFMLDAVDGPWVLSGGHFPGHTLTGLPPWTAYRCRSRVNTIVGWSAFSQAIVAHTAGAFPERWF